MAINASYLTYISDQLKGIKGVETKKMFGGIGFFQDGKMFGMIGNDVFRLKVDDTNQADYEKRGMEPYHSSSKKKGMPYWEVPEDVISDKSALKKWAQKSINIAHKDK